jgi:hypothetical protein
LLIIEVATRNLDSLFRNVAPLRNTDRLEKKGMENWMRTQIRGLADAPAKMHRPNDAHLDSHHDVELDNILVFGTVTKGSTLKFAVWGCSGFGPHQG